MKKFLFVLLPTNLFVFGKGPPRSILDDIEILNQVLFTNFSKTKYKFLTT